ncbi:MULTISPECIES: hypothetical protein [unclassified Sphingomonas]|uniref:hypothetical protein n=1 Tax=unclassified Sphingomonas TaxID=196159 RepID=UPI0008356604|nr:MULTISPECIES: hypothetical protein [unclassified Sphingomonas]
MALGNGHRPCPAFAYPLPVAATIIGVRRRAVMCRRSGGHDRTADTVSQRSDLNGQAGLIDISNSAHRGTASA